MAIFTGTGGIDRLTGTTQGDSISGLGGDDYLEGDLGADTINGGDGNDALFSSVDLSGVLDPEDDPLDFLWDDNAVADTLDGGAGDDVLFAGFNDTVRGGDGYDRVLLNFKTAGSGVVANLAAAFSGGTSTVDAGTISGIEGYHTIIGSAFGDTITLTGSLTSLAPTPVYYTPQGVYAGAGDDTVTGGEDADRLFGGTGADHLGGGDSDDLLVSGDDPSAYFDPYEFVTRFPAWDTGTEIDVLEGGNGWDQGFIGLGDSFDGGIEEATFGGAGDFVSIWLTSAKTGVTVDLRAAFAGGSSTVAGGMIAHLDGYEAIQGSFHADVIDVGGGRSIKTGDVMAGLFGNGGADRIWGSADGDIIFGDGGADTLTGRAGDDWIYAGSPDESYADFLSVASPYERYYLAVDDVESERDTLLGGAGNDVLSAGTGDSVDGGSVDDTLILSLLGASGPVTMDLTAAFSGGTSLVDGAVVRGLERYGRIDGSDLADTITLGDARTAAEQYGSGTISMRGGDDVVFAGRDADLIHGDDGNDRLAGRGGDDTIDGGSGADTLNGGDGDDRLEGGYNNDTLSGGAGNDVLVGAQGGDKLLGGAGIDLADYSSSGRVVINLARTDRQDTIGSGRDLLTGIENVAGSGEGDRLLGNGVGNALWGNDGNDRLNGRGGDDVLSGGNGSDTLTGGAGRDTFVFAALDAPTVARDTITDFSSGIDRLAFDREVFAAFEDANAGGIDPAQLVLGTAAAAARQVLIYDQAAGRLWYDADGSGAGAKILIADLGAGTALAAQDIVLV